MPVSFEKMCRRTGGYSLPFLIKLYDKDETESLYFINDTQDRVYETVTYKATAFEYIPGKDETGFGGGGSLNIAVTELDSEMTKIIDMIETYRVICLEVTGCLLEDGTVTEIKTFSNSYGSVDWDGKSARFTFDRDDRLDMTFPALVFSHYNNRGN